MNQHIKELAEQAGLETQPAKLKIYKNDDGTVTSGGWEYPLEKFAELIVRECMEVVINGQYSASECHGNSHRISYNNGRTGASSDIKKHFGVEE